ncbi:MAG: DEAD/DEAH box helicase [Anaerolineae bacterium]|nr:DEAD/DEAH box helicase [Anaerolineae bacterium]
MSWLTRLFERTVIRELPLAFFVEEDVDGKHHVSIFQIVNGQREPIRNFQEIARYGYTLNITTSEEHIVYRLSQRDLHTLLAIKSLNPELRPDGVLVVDVLPDQLRYLRTRPNLDEGERSRQLTISEGEEPPVMEVTFDEQTGLEAIVGYRDETGALTPFDELQPIPDNRYVRLGRRFIQLPRALSNKAHELLARSRFKVPLDGIPEFFLRDLVVLKEEFQAVLVGRAREIHVIAEPLKPVVSVGAAQPGWLDFKVTYEAEGFVLPPELLPRSAGNQHVRFDETTWAAVNPETVATVDAALRDLQGAPFEGGFRVPASQFASLEEFVQKIGGRQVVSAAFETFLNTLTDFRHDTAFRLSESAEAQLKRKGITLRPYQRAGIHWLHWLRQHHLHGLLADDMGLGKTIQAISVLRAAYEHTQSGQHSLIIAPRSVLLHWERELHRCYPEIRVYRYHGPDRRVSYLQAPTPTIFITTYATTANDIEVLKTIPFFYLILDEASFIKNPGAKRTASIKKLNSAHRLALSGTPVENRPAELWSIYDFLMRGHLGKYGTFTQEFEQQIAQGDVQASERLGRRIKPFLLRRMKEDVATDLPGKIEMNEWCSLTKEQRQLYGGLQDTIKGLREALQSGAYVNYATNVLPVLTKLKQICDHPAMVTEHKSPIHGRSEKFDWIIDKITEISEQGDQVVVFSHFLDMLTLMGQALHHKHITFIRIDGSTRDRQTLIDTFNNGGAPVALCSLRATGFGINMQSANHVIHADRWWNPAIEDQATDRVHRIGQTQIVYVYRILTEGTLEERIDALLAAKRHMADRIMGAAKQDAHEWSREELLEILRPLD